MKRWLILAALIFAAREAFALQNARQDDIRGIQQKIDAANKAKALIEFLDADTPDEEKAAAKYKTRRAALEKRRQNAYDQAIWLTIRAYDILPFRYGQPALPEGITHLPSPEKGKRQQITWLPVFEDKTGFRIQNDKGEVLMRVNLDDAAANTAMDGVSRIFPEAFQSPVELASFLVHEKIHFEQFLDPSRGPIMTTGEMEVEAYTAMKDLMDNGPLIFTVAERRRHDATVTKMIEEKRDQIARENAIKAQGGTPLQASIVSHTLPEIDDLVTRARLQVRIAQEDHDKRLQRTLIDIANRSCRSPGTISTEELRELAVPYGIFVPLSRPPVAANCLKAYEYLAYGGRNAEELDRLSPRIEPVLVRPIETPVTAAPATYQTPFNARIPGLRRYAASACATPDLVALDTELTQPKRPYSFFPDADRRVLQEQSQGLDDCSKKLLTRLFEVIVGGQGDRISAKWVQDTAADYRAAATAPQQQPGQVPYYDPCRANGNKYCP